MKKIVYCYKHGVSASFLYFLKAVIIRKSRDYRFNFYADDFLNQYSITLPLRSCCLGFS